MSLEIDIMNFEDKMCMPKLKAIAFCIQDIYKKCTPIKMAFQPN